MYVTVMVRMHHYHLNHRYRYLRNQLPHMVLHIVQCAHGTTGKLVRNVKIFEPAFYSPMCNENEDIGSCTGLPIPDGLPPLPAGWTGGVIKYREDEESGGANRNSVGQGFCSGDDLEEVPDGQLFCNEGQSEEQGTCGVIKRTTTPEIECWD